MKGLNKWGSLLPTFSEEKRFGVSAKKSNSEGASQIFIPVRDWHLTSGAKHRVVLLIFFEAAERLDVDLRQYENLYFSNSFSDARDLWKTARVLLMPSVWEEPAGRLPVEAALNDVVPLVSDRGGLPEQLGDTAPVFQLPNWYRPESQGFPTSEEVKPCLDELQRLYDDEAYFQRRSQMVREFAEAK